MILFWVFYLHVLCFVHGSDIFRAVASDKANLVRAALMAEPGSLNAKGQGGQTPLMNAVLQGKATSVKILLEAGADVRIPEQDGYTPMHGAGFQGRADIAKILIAHGIAVDEVHKDGFLPMHRACWGAELRHAETVAVFLDAGVSADAKASDGRTCEQMTRNKDTIKLLKDNHKNRKLKEGSEL